MTSIRRPSHHAIEVELGGVHPTNTTDNTLSTNTTESTSTCVMERSSITHGNTSSLKKLPNSSCFNWRTVMVGSLVVGVLLLLVVALTIIFTRYYVNPHPQNGTAVGGNTDTDVVKSRSTLEDPGTSTTTTPRSGSIAVWWGAGGDVPTGPQPFHNIGEVGRGYDLLYGNPHSTDGADPGVRAAVFSMATMYIDDGKPLPDARISDDGRFLIPKGVDVYQDVSCRLDWSTTIVSSSSDYRSSLQNSVSASVSVNYLFYSASFSMSRDYKEVSARTQSGSSTYAKSSAECSLYTANIHVSDVPNLSNSFKSDIMRILQSDNGESQEQSVDDIINKYGTHVPTRVIMGARYGQQSELSAHAASSSVETELKQTAKLSVMSSLNAEGMSEEDLKNASAFSKSCYSQRLFTMGSTPTQDGQGTTWAAQGIMDPAPIGQHELIPIHTLVTPDFFKGEGITRDKVEALQGVFLARLQSYCSRETGESPLCALTGDVPDDRCVGGWLQQTQLSNGLGVSLFNPVTGGANCPAGYTWLTGFQRAGTDYRKLDFMPICVSLKASDCFLANPPFLGTSFGGYYINAIDVNPTGLSTVTCDTYSLSIIQVDGTCKCPPGYHNYTVFRRNILCLRSGGRDAGSTFGGGFDTLNVVGNGYILDPNILDNVGVSWTVFDCPIGYRVAPFLDEFSYICVLDSNKLLSNVRPVAIKFPNNTAASNTTAKPVNRTMNVHKLHTLQHTIEAHIDAAADEPFQMIHTLDDDAADEHNNNETSPSPLDSLADLGDSLDDDDAFHNITLDPHCIAEFEDDQHAATARRCFRTAPRSKRPQNTDDRSDIHIKHSITLGNNRYHLDTWGRVEGYTCLSKDGCTQAGKGRYGSHSKSLIKFLRECFGAVNDGTDDDQAGHLLAVRLGVTGTTPAAMRIARLYNNDPLNFIPLARTVNVHKGAMGFANWGNAEDYAAALLEVGCKVDIFVTLRYPPIKRGRFRETDYRPTYWTFEIDSWGKRGCASKTYQGHNG